MGTNREFPRVDVPYVQMAALRLPVVGDLSITLCLIRI